ncbi:hypothetical protein GCM10017668_03100 [Streptomyces tuirus]|uniref:Bacterial bifunctional deaminase-reductase C-terminal domain-containing protein n=1 Tax=Streptomyces tuirus TaxID=68278 RepID=A0A7G1N9P7_9ACTN|nr:hypothetical protein GCM10017668_03100 [Streptomyces tuirus]
MDDGHAGGSLPTSHTGDHTVASAAGRGDVTILGGATTINQYFAAGLVHELRLHIAPLTLAAGTRLFEGVPPLTLEQLTSRAASRGTHVTYRVST